MACGGGYDSTINTIMIENYEYANFTPWIEHAYVLLKNIYETEYIGPIDVIAGKQPLKYDDGFVIDDDNQGIFALKAETPMPFNTDLDIFRAKISDGDAQNLTGRDFDLTGLVLRYNGFKYITPKVYYIVENDKSRAYITDGDSNKNFYGLRLDGKTTEELYYKAELIKQGGEVKRDNPADNFSYDAHAYILGVWMDTVSSKFGKTRLRLEHAKGSGDKSDSDENQYLTKRGFTPRLENRTKDFGENYYGEIFSQVKPGLSNKSIVLLGFDFNPYKKLHFGFDYLRLSRNIPSGVYGEEIDMFFYTTFVKSVGIRLVYALLRPGKALNETGSNLKNTILELTYKF
ncbi:alginate export family protein [bacterium]